MPKKKKNSAFDELYPLDTPEHLDHVKQLQTEATKLERHLQFWQSRTQALIRREWKVRQENSLKESREIRGLVNAIRTAGATTKLLKQVAEEQCARKERRVRVNRRNIENRVAESLENRAAGFGKGGTSQTVEVQNNGETAVRVEEKGREITEKFELQEEEFIAAVEKTLREAEADGGEGSSSSSIAGSGERHRANVVRFPGKKPAPEKKGTKSYYYSFPKARLVSSAPQNFHLRDHRFVFPSPFSRS